jgi:hypothetical protein
MEKRMKQLFLDLVLWAAIKLLAPRAVELANSRPNDLETFVVVGAHNSIVELCNYRKKTEQLRLAAMDGQTDLGGQ